MLQGYHLITLTHRTASLDAIGQLIPAKEDLFDRLQVLKQHFGWEEIFCLNTCNRAMFAFYSHQELDTNTLKSDLVQVLNPLLSAVQTAHLTHQMHFYHGGDAVRHIFEVAASMDSLVVGEREIIRQLRQAYDQCNQWGLTGDHFRLLITQAIEVSKQVFTETGIGEKALSVVALAYQAMKNRGLQTHHHIVLVGAGATNELLAKFLAKDGFQHVTIFNRTLDKAQKIAAHFTKGKALHLNELPNIAVPFDALVVCTGAVQPIITKALYAAIIHDDPQTKILTDLSVPNNVAADVPTSFPTHFIEIEGLKSMAVEHLAHREQARQSATILITERVLAFKNLWHERQVERSLHPMIDQIKTVKARTIDLVFADRFAGLDQDAQALVLEMLDYMEKKCIAIPVKTMKDIAASRIKGKPIIQKH
jgi:glutamyl-tRNA reductase